MREMKGIKGIVFSCALFIMMAPSLLGYAASTSPAALDVAGTNLSQGAYHITVAMCTIANKFGPNLALTPKVTSSPTEDLRLLNAGNVAIGYVSEMAVYAALRGIFPFKDKVTPNLRMLFCDTGFVYPIIASRESGIKSVADLKGKKMVGWSSTSIFGKATLLAALEVYGVPAKDVTILEGKSTPECLRMLQEGVVQAASFPMTPQSSGVVDLLSTRPSIFLQIPKATNEKIIQLAFQKYNTMLMGLTIPANTYDTQTQDLLYAGSPDGWACKAEMSDTTAYNIVKALFDHEEEFLTMQPGKKGLKGVTHTTATTSMFAIPFHPGAIKYYKERGWWTAEKERKQQWALGEMEKLGRNKGK